MNQSLPNSLIYCQPNNDDDDNKNNNINKFLKLIDRKWNEFKYNYKNNIVTDYENIKFDNYFSIYDIKHK